MSDTTHSTMIIEMRKSRGKQVAQEPPKQRAAIPTVPEPEVAEVVKSRVAVEEPASNDAGEEKQQAPAGMFAEEQDDEMDWADEDEDDEEKVDVSDAPSWMTETPPWYAFVFFWSIVALSTLFITMLQVSNQ